MSRVGNNPINITDGVEILIDDSVVTVQGKLGTLSQEIDDRISISQNDSELTLVRSSDSKIEKSLHGLYRALLFNMIHGVSVGWTKELELVGVGYRASNSGQLLDLHLGFSHNILFEVCSEVKVETVSEKGKNPLIKLTSHDKQLLGSISAKIRSFRKPEPYKGKGIKFVGEQIRRKDGKSA